jgi:hypothetical protein
MNQPRGEAPGTGPGAGAQPAGGVRHAPDVAAHREFATHPDAEEMRARFAKVLEGPRATAVDGLTVLAGLYAAISPWVVHFQATNTIMAVNNLVIGLAIAVLGIGMAARPMRLLQFGWVISALGVWLIISPWVASLHHSPASPLIWTNAFTGGVVVVLGLGAMGVLASGRHRSRM